MLLPSLLTCIDSDENSDVILRSIPPYVTYPFSLVSYKNFSLSPLFSNLIDIPWCNFPLVSCPCALVSFLSFLDVWVSIVLKVWKGLGHYLCKYYFGSPPLSPSDVRETPSDVVT